MPHGHVAAMAMAMATYPHPVVGGRAVLQVHHRRRQRRIVGQRTGGRRAARGRLVVVGALRLLEADTEVLLVLAVGVGVGGDGWMAAMVPPARLVALRAHTRAVVAGRLRLSVRSHSHDVGRVGHGRAVRLHGAVEVNDHASTTTSSTTTTRHEMPVGNRQTQHIHPDSPLRLSLPLSLQLLPRHAQRVGSSRPPAHHRHGHPSAAPAAARRLAVDAARLLGHCVLKARGRGRRQRRAGSMTQRRVAGRPYRLLCDKRGQCARRVGGLFAGSGCCRRWRVGVGVCDIRGVGGRLTSPGDRLA
mmetsp:Transcript_46618/g.116142  ORF Transcript_46618/g.116142 Transcript_46618/m.116142 type:complete len:302 (+) Transcript_46618:997-1902(+)